MSQRAARALRPYVHLSRPVRSDDATPSERDLQSRVIDQRGENTRETAHGARTRRSAPECAVGRGKLVFVEPAARIRAFFSPPPAAVLPKRNRKKRNAAERSTLSVSDRDRVGRHHPTRSIDLIYLFDDDVVVARVTSVGLRTSRRRIYGGNREEATRETRVFRVGFPARHTFATFAIVHIWLS